MQVQPQQAQILQGQQMRGMQARLVQHAFIRPNDLFRPENDPRNFTQFDNMGMPTHDNDGNPITDEFRKTLDNDYKAHIKLRKLLKINN